MKIIEFSRLKNLIIPWIFHTSLNCLYKQLEKVPCGSHLLILIKLYSYIQFLLLGNIFTIWIFKACSPIFTFHLQCFNALLMFSIFFMFLITLCSYLGGMCIVVIFIKSECPYVYFLHLKSTQISTSFVQLGILIINWTVSFISGN